MKELKEVDWTSVLEEKGVNEATNSFLNILSSILLKHTREVKISRSKAVIEPWITPGLLRCSRQRDRLHILARKQPKNKIITTSYSRYRNFCNDLLRKLKSEYESNELEKNHNNTKALWNTIKEICHFKQKHDPPTELLTISENSSESLHICNDFFASVGRNLADKILTETKGTEENLASEVNIANGPINSFFLSPTDSIEVDSLISSLKNNSAPGLDGFTNNFVKMAKKYIVSPLTHIFNLSFSVGIFPEAWKIASITPVHKGGPKNIPNNYRPISLLSVFSKLLEKLINKRLTSFLDSNGLLSENQYGFRRLKSTEDAVHKLVTHVATQLDKGWHCFGVFLDLAKAFDTVSIPILLRKLERMGIRGTALNWFQSYLAKRDQLVRIESRKSTTIPTYYGVPQGSILGPLLFIIYMNDIHDLQLESAEIVCYADDTAIVFHGQNWDVARQVAEKGIQSVYNWLQNNLLTRNTEKTKYLCFHKTAKSQPPPLPDLRIHTCNSTLSSTCQCNQIQRTKEIKYLGLILDEQLNFASHIQTLAGRIRKVIGIIKVLRNSASIHILKLVYFAICQSLLSYCIGVWGGAGKTFMLPLERAQRAVLKVMMRKDFRFSTDSLYKEACVLRVRQLYIHKACLSTHKSIINSDEHKALLTKRVFNLSLPSAKSNFVKKFKFFAFRSIYNKVNKLCDIKNCSVYACSKKLTSWLLSIDYDTTESIISSPITLIGTC
ncbi:hypothetical protein O3G_MSEX010099 [Manduca sexta]|uniref:Reverse transcriptase domain-containing protein n=1 Tax=Manduca sexta TaxID=7130 RepID=A0A922CST1_MANSE|nr:hypothetical protein O3G_MSEX010099 [Manduca sexta]